MSEYLKQQASKHEVMYEFSGQGHFFNVISGNSGEPHSVMINAACDCRYFAVQGSANSEICSHILAVMNQISQDGGIAKFHRLLLAPKHDFEKCKLNEGLRVIRNSNIVMNEVRTSSSESVRHALAKKVICDILRILEIDYICEAIFKTGGRCDIFVPIMFMAIEIVVSEKDESLDEKVLLYPQGIRIEVIRA